MCYRSGQLISPLHQGAVLLLYRLTFDTIAINYYYKSIFMNEREIITHIVHPLLELLDLAKNTKDLATINKLNEALTKRYLYCMSLLELVAMYAPAGKLDEVFQHLTLKNNAKFRNKFVLNLIEDSRSEERRVGKE